MLQHCHWKPVKIKQGKKIERKSYFSLQRRHLYYANIYMYVYICICKYIKLAYCKAILQDILSQTEYKTKANVFCFNKFYFHLKINAKKRNWLIRKKQTSLITASGLVIADISWSDAVLSVVWSQLTPGKDIINYQAPKS